MIDRIPPAATASVRAREDLTDARLFPEEEAALGDAVDKRRREYTTVRARARRAPVQLGLDPVPVVPGYRGAPQWPDGVVGRMTRCAGCRAAAARATDSAAVGADAEPHQALPEGVSEAVARPVTFHPRELTRGSESGCFAARLLVPGPPRLTKPSGRWMVRGGLSLVAVAPSAPAPGQG